MKKTPLISEILNYWKKTHNKQIWIKFCLALVFRKPDIGSQLNNGGFFIDWACDILLALLFIVICVGRQTHVQSY